MYRLMRSRKLIPEHLASGLFSSKRPMEVNHFQYLSAALDACETANYQGMSRYYVLNESGQEYLAGSWID